MASLVAIISIPIVFLAVVISKRELVLKFPELGSWLFRLVTGFSPPYLQSDIFKPKAQAQWQGANNVIIATPAKTGDVWLAYTLHHIRAKGDPEPYRELFEEVRWIEFTYFPGQKLKERIALLKRQEEKYPTLQLYKTELPLSKLHIRDDAKYVVSVRNMVDVAADIFAFARSHDKHFARAWGNYPGNAGEPDNEQDMYEFRLDYLGVAGGKPLIDILFLNHLAEFWPLRKQPNVRLVHFANRQKRATEEIKSLADFVGVDLTPQQVQLVAERTSHTAMLKDQAKFEFNHIFDEYRERKLLPKKMLGMITPGATVKTADDFTFKFRAAVQQHVENRFGKEIAAWIENGGEIPDVELPQTK